MLRFALPLFFELSNIHHTGEPGINPGSCEGSTVPLSYKTSAMLLIDNSGKSFIIDRGKNKFTFYTRPTHLSWIYIVLAH